MSGRLTVRPKCAKLTRDTEFFGKMDPYVVVKIGSFTQTSSVHSSGGKFPSWQDSLTFNLAGEQTMEVEVWYKDKMKKDHLVSTEETKLY